MILWYFDATHCRWKIGSRRHPIPDFVQILLEILFKVLNRLTVYSCCAFTGSYAFICLFNYLLGSILPDPNDAHGVPRAKVYLVLESAAGYYERALQKGGTGLSDLAVRDWGHKVAYCLDPDGHVLAFAEKANV